MSLAELERTGAVTTSGRTVVEMDSVDKDFVLGGTFFNHTVLRALSGV